MNAPWSALVLCCGALLMPLWVQAQPAPALPAPALAGWQQCTQQTEPNARLACFDQWAGRQSATPPMTVTALPTTLPELPPHEMPTTPQPTAAVPDCRQGPHSALSRFWELEAGSDCGRFNIRGYRPISLSWIHADTVNRSPSSPTAGHANNTELPYLVNEGRIQLSVRTKIGQGLLPVEHFGGRDSLWFGYTQQSYWQLFTSSISRPFRNTDHEPEFIYIAPMPAALPGGWQLRYGGIGFNHQSNGQSLPLSRSWNRAILMAGIEKDNRFTLTGRLWSRIPDGDEVDDNPYIDNYIGRGELTGGWQVNRDNTLLLTARHSLRSEANGSYRLEWLQTLGSNARGPYASGLRLHVQLFNGYGDSLVDYNRGRTVLSIGLSLVDW